MQHIGTELNQVNTGVLLERSKVNFASIANILYRVKDFKQRYPQLSEIDPYGDTIFTIYQVPPAIEELEKLKQETRASEVINEIQDTIEFLRKVEQNTFAKFIGD